MHAVHTVIFHHRWRKLGNIKFNLLKHVLFKHSLTKIFKGVIRVGG